MPQWVHLIKSENTIQLSTCVGVKSVQITVSIDFTRFFREIVILPYWASCREISQAGMMFLYSTPECAGGNIVMRPTRSPLFRDEVQTW